MGNIFESDPLNYSYHPPIKDEIVLMAGRPNYDTKGLDSNLCELVNYCGCNAIGTIISLNDLSNSLNNCQSSNLKLFLYNGAILAPKTTSSIVKTYAELEGMGGWILDFNARNDFQSDNNPGETIYNIKEAVKEIHSLYDESDNGFHRLPIFIGISGDWIYDRRYQMFNSYPSYVADFQSYFQPSLWPVCYFPDLLPTDKSKIEKEAKKRRLIFYISLEYFSAISKYTGVPFWFYCRCQGIKLHHSYTAPSPSIHMMRGIIFTSLAYGAQGIYYWNFRQSNSENYYDAPLNVTGQKTTTYNMIQQINQEVKTFNKVFFGCKMVECRHVTSDSGNNWLKVMEHPIGPLMYFNQFYATSPEVLVSHIVNEGNNYLVIVASPFADESTSQNIMMRFNEYWNLYYLFRDAAGKIVEIKQNTPFYACTLAPGDYLIFRWE